MLKHAVAFVVSAVMLVGCGGGGGSGDAQDSGGGPDQPSFPITYTGKTEPASLTQESAGVFFRYLLSGDAMTSAADNTSLFRSLYAPIDGNFLLSAKAVREALNRTIPRGATQARAVANINERMECPQGGDVTIVGSIDELAGTGDLNASYRNCTESNEVSNGEMRFVFETGAADSLWREFVNISTPGFVVSSPTGRMSLMGTARMSDSGSCLLETTENFLVRDDQTGIVIRTENLVTLEDSCRTLTPFALTSFTGRLYHAQQGYVDVATPKAIGFAYASSDLPNAAGELVLTGAQGSLVRLVNAQPVDASPDEALAISTISFDVDGDGVPERFLTLTARAVQEGAVFDMGDSDGDGMLNGWERIYRLDPNDAADAVLDQDGDGYSNLVEANYLTDPRDAENVPVTMDLRVVVSGPPIWVAPPASEVLLFEFYATTASGRSLSVDKGPLTYTITKSANVEWVEMSICSVDTTNPNRLSCRIAANEYPSLQVKAPVAPDEAFWVQAEVTSAAIDPNPIDNTTTLNATTIVRRSDTSVGMNSSGPSPVGAPQNLAAAIGVQYDTDDALDTVLRLNLPPAIEFDSVTGTKAGTSSKQIYSCAGDRIVSCDIGKVERGSWQNLAITVHGTSPGNYPVTIEVSAIGQDDNTANNTATITLGIGLDASAIQAEIDAAPPAAEVKVPNGMYIGALDFRGKGLHLIGESADAQLAGTIVMAPNSSVSNLQLIAGATILVQSGARIENNIFSSGGIESATEDTGTGPIAVTTSNVVVARNTFFGWTPVRLKTDSVRIENNVFLGCESCDAAVFLEYPTPATNPGRIIVQNNTIVGARNGSGAGWLRGVRLWGTPVDTSTIDIRNNIFSDVYRAIDVMPLDSPPVGAINNIYFGGFTVRPVNGNVVIQNDIRTDPKFVDAPQLDFRLTSKSPAIDAGIGTGAPANDITGQARPVDGNGDGAAAWDIGAYEFVP